MANVGHKQSRELIVRWRYAGLGEDEFEDITGHPFASAAAMTWADLDRCHQRIAAVYRDRATPQGPRTPGNDGIAAAASDSHSPNEPPADSERAEPTLTGTAHGTRAAVSKPTVAPSPDYRMARSAARTG